MNVEALPKVLICLATHNGFYYLQEQIESILNQRNISISINISDDLSIDRTIEYLQLIINDPRIVLLPSFHKFGSAGRNFYRLIIDSDFSNYDYVAFADQDDIWLPGKLERHIELIQRHHADGVSSNVLAFWPDGKVKLIDKAQAQRGYDFLFESAGPGCTFLITAGLLVKVKNILIDHADIAQQVTLHDWLTYAICRSLGKKWIIDPIPSVRYRQHSHNVIGANSGAKAFWSRFKKLTNGWYRQEVIKVTQVSMLLSPDPELRKIYSTLTTPGLKNRLALLKFLPQMRRGLKDRIYLAGSILLGIF
ncbi:MAG: glycosyl transferase family 2 [Methylotenera sp.]|nr:MAG: glycosyl transferase family 2 [Methylotenera sp.]